MPGNYNDIKWNSHFAVLSDFDGTITSEDTLVFLLNRFGKSQWWDIERRMLTGEISEKQGVTEEISLLNVSWDEAIKAILQEIEIKPDFPAFVKWTQKQDIPLIILSGGFTSIIQAFFGKYGLNPLEIRANRAEVIDRRWNLIPSPLPHIRGLCNHCKTYSVLEMKETGYTTIYIGDGFTDRCPAQYADIVFASGELEKYCRAQGINLHSFSDFGQIREFIEKNCHAILD